MREDALPQPVSPYGVTQARRRAARATCTRVNHGVPTTSRALLHGVRPAAAARHGRSTIPDAPPLEGEPIIGLRRRRADARLHLRRRRGRGDDRAPASAACPGAPTISAAARACRSTRSLDLIGRVTGRPLRHPARAAAEGRHARHLRRHVAGARRPRLRARDRRSRRASRPSIAGLLRLPVHCMTTAASRRSGSRALVSPCLLAAWSSRPAAAKKDVVPTGTPSPTSSCSTRAPRRSRRSTGSPRASTSGIIDNVSAEPVPARREARPRRHLPRRGHVRVADARASTSSRVPVVLPDARARRLRAVQARDDALPADAGAAARPDRDARGHAGVRDLRRAVSEQHAACPRCKEKLREARTG